SHRCRGLHVGWPQSGPGRREGRAGCRPAAIPAGSMCAESYSAGPAAPHEVYAMNLNVRLIAALAALPLGACQSGPVGITSVSILLKAPPGNVEASVITISRIELIGPTGAITLLHQPRTIDLLDPTQAPNALVSDYAVPAMAYQELRVHLRGMYLAVWNPDGTTSSFVTPGFDGLPQGAPARRTVQPAGWHEASQPAALADGGRDL